MDYKRWLAEFNLSWLLRSREMWLFWVRQAAGWRMAGSPANEARCLQNASDDAAQSRKRYLECMP